MLSISRLSLAAVLLCAVFVSGCSSGEAPPAKKKGWSLWPWDVSKAGDATPYIEYQRTRSEGAEPLYTLTARNTHQTKTMEGRMQTTMQVAPGDMKMDSQSFTLAPNEQKKLLVYPARFPLNYEVSAFFRE